LEEIAVDSLPHLLRFTGEGCAEIVASIESVSWSGFMMVIVAMLQVAGAPQGSEAPAHQLEKSPLSLEIRKPLCDTTEIA